MPKTVALPARTDPFDAQSWEDFFKKNEKIFRFGDLDEAEGLLKQLIGVADRAGKVIQNRRREINTKRCYVCEKPFDFKNTFPKGVVPYSDLYGNDQRFHACSDMCMYKLHQQVAEMHDRDIAEKNEKILERKMKERHAQERRDIA